MAPGEIYLANFPFGGGSGMKLRPLLTLTGPLVRRLGELPAPARAAVSVRLRDMLSL